ncbi:hypothetical protein Pint_06491 [Pistacia integerrima]|uniref:Uncharacterized protein n=1 Tax=Pistacia integerrima TaxID=434235 RepID=A0ACC0Z4X1_9ROSI|nr:hypothetical protein Pint_06491 [Pistacia integerrima]
MNKTTPPPPLPPPPPPNPNQESTEPQLLRTLIKILTEDTTALESLTPHIQHLAQPVLLSLLSSKTLAKRPNTLISFFKWAQSHLPPSLRQSPLPLLSLLPSFFQHRKYLDAKSLLVSFINSDRQCVLHSYIVNPSNWDPKKYGIKLSKPLFDTCICAYVQSGKPHLAAQIFSKMKRLKVKPGLFSCNVLITGLVRHPSSHSILLANKVFKDMTSVLGVKPDTTTINVLIYGCCLEKNFVDALEWLKNIEAFGCLPDNITEGQVEKAFQFHNKMVENSFKPDVFTCNILLRGLCRKGMLEKALKLFNTWISKGRTIDAASRSEDFKSKMVEEGKLKDLPIQLVQGQSAVPTETSKGFDSSSIAYSEQINELCSQGEYKDAMRIFEETTQKGITINKSTYVNLMDGLIKRRKSISKADYSS